MTTLVMVILHDLAYMPDLLEAWKQKGIPGATILHSIGGFQATEFVQHKGLGNFLKVFDELRSTQRTIFSIIDDPELIETAISEADRIVKGFDRPHSGILFTLPVGQVLGLQKWGPDNREGEDQQEGEKEDQARANLMQWLQEDIERQHGKDALLDWSSQRNIPVSDIIQKSNRQPALVKMEYQLPEVLSILIKTPDTCTACVINNEERLMGLIESQMLAEWMFIPVIPEAYLDDPKEYDRTIKFASIHHLPLAADIIRDPVFVHPEDTLENAYQLMKDNRITDLPVVDHNYRVLGYISLLELMEACFYGLDLKDE
jgi:PII-like signaling protein